MIVMIPAPALGSKTSPDTRAESAAGVRADRTIRAGGFDPLGYVLNPTTQAPTWLIQAADLQEGDLAT